ncbi:transposase [Novosphingobium sp. G106]|nr:transposase [Novosphingobium sp. G106]
MAQNTERGYPVAEVSQRLGGSPHSLYAWKRRISKVVTGEAGKEPRSAS